jgi:hypothetical protein
LSSDPVASAAKGVTEGFLEWTSDKVREFVRRLQNRELAFVQDKRNIDVVRAERVTEEYNLLERYVPKGRLRILSQMGLTLRAIENEKERVTELRDNIRRKYGNPGLHIAELVQIGLVRELLARLVGIFREHADIEKTLNFFSRPVRGSRSIC